MAALPSSRREWALIVGALLAISSIVSVWLALDRRPPAWDYANHLERAWLCGQDLSRGDVPSLLERSSFYPPFVTCAAAVVTWLLPSDRAAAHAVLILFLGIGMASVYLATRTLGNGAAGVVAAVAFATAPFVVYSTLNFQLDLPLASVVALALYAGLRSDGFERPGWSIATGVVAGLGMLTKPTFPVYVVPPLAVTLLGHWRRRTALTALGAAVIAAAISAPWYGPRLLGFPMQIGNRSFKQAAESGHPEPFTWAGLAFYPRWFVPEVGGLVIVLAVLGLAIAVRRRLWFPVIALVVPFVVLVTLQNKNLRYALPLVPTAAILAGLAVSAFGPRLRLLTGGAVAIVGTVQVLGTTFGVPAPYTLPRLDVPSWFAAPPSGETWHHQEILQLITRHSEGLAANVSIVPNVAEFSTSNFRYYAVRDGLPVRIGRAWDSPLGIRYMVLKSGDQGPSWTVEKPNRITRLLATDADLARVFPIIGQFPLPDGSTATVRARNVPPVTDMPAAALAESIDAAIRREVQDYARDVERLGVTLEYDDTIRLGHIRRLGLTAAAATLGELRRPRSALLRVHDVKIVVDEVVVDPYSARAAGRLQALDAGRARFVGARITAGDLEQFLHGVKGFRGTSVTLAEGAIDVVMRGRGPTLAARVSIEPRQDVLFRLSADRVRYGGIPVPESLVGWLLRQYDPGARIASRLPIHVELGRVDITPDAIHLRDALSAGKP